MAVEAITWAYRQDLKGMAKFTLVTLCNWSSKTGHCWGWLAKVARYTGQTERSVWSHIEQLEKAGLIRREVREAERGHRVVYDFWLPWEAVKDDPSEADPHPDKRPGTEQAPQKNFQSTSEKFSEPYKEDTTQDTTTKFPDGNLSAPGRAIERPPDLKSEIFGTCLDWLARQCGKPKDRLRPMVGRWCRDHGDGRVLETMTQAARAGPVEPVAWIEQVLREGRDGRRQERFGGLTAGQAAVAGITGRGP